MIQSARRGARPGSAICHPAPFYLDQQYHDLKTERFLNEAPLGPVKSFTLRGIKDSPPCLHDGRCLTLEDTVEFFNLVLQTKLTEAENRISRNSPGRCKPLWKSCGWHSKLISPG